MNRLRARAAGSVGLSQICLAGVLWGTGGLAVQLIRHLTPLSPLTISVYRTGIATVVMFGATAVTFGTTAGAREWPGVRALLRERPLSAVAVGGAMAAYQGLYFTSVTWVGVTVSTVVSLGFAPLVLTVFDAVRSRARPTRGRVLVLATALTGLVLVSVFSGSHSTGPHPVLGVVAAIGSGSSYAFTTAAGRTLVRSYRPLVVTSAMMGISTCVLLPFFVVGAIAGSGPLVSPDPRVYLWLVYLGVLTMAVAYALLYAGLRTVTESSAVIVTLLEPVTAAVAAAVILGERLGPAAVLGTVMILAAVAGLERGAAAKAGAGAVGAAADAGQYHAPQDSPVL